MCPPEDALSPSSPVLHTAHIMRCIKYLLVFVRLGLHFLHLKTIKNRNREAGSSPPLASCLCVEGRIDSRAELQISTPLPLPPSSPSAFFFSQCICVYSISHPLRHAKACERVRMCAHAHTLRRTCTLIPTRINARRCTRSLETPACLHFAF